MLRMTNTKSRNFSKVFLLDLGARDSKDQIHQKEYKRDQTAQKIRKFLLASQRLTLLLEFSSSKLFKKLFCLSLLKIV